MENNRQNWTQRSNNESVMGSLPSVIADNLSTPEGALFTQKLQEGSGTLWSLCIKV